MPYFLKRRGLFDPEGLFNNSNVLFVGNSDALAADIYEKNGNLVVEVNVPGMKKEEIEVSVEEDHLKVSGVREEREEVAEKNFYKKEISTGGFERLIPLPCYIDSDNVKASYEKGVLKVVMLKKNVEEEGVKKIEVS